jgi:hypothetical protein
VEAEPARLRVFTLRVEAEPARVRVAFRVEAEAKAEEFERGGVGDELAKPNLREFELLLIFLDLTKLENFICVHG